MAEIVNLRSLRKQKARAEKERKAEANRALHGRTRAERLNEATSRARETASHDGRKLEWTPDPSDGDAGR